MYNKKENIIKVKNKKLQLEERERREARKKN